MPVIVVNVSHSGRVLVTDDDPEMQVSIHQQLDTLGWDAMVVNTGEEALRVVEMGLTFELLVTELRLPDGDGRDVAWIICSRHTFTRVVFMCRGMPGDRLEPGGAPVLRKPCSTLALRGAIARATRLTSRSW